MKYLIALFLLASCFFTSQKAHALVVKIDSVYADSCYQDGNYAVTPSDSTKMFKKYDSTYGQLTGNGPTLDMAFKKFKSNSTQPIKAGSTILVWGKKDLLADSSAGQITFNRYDESLGMLISSSPTVLNDGLQSVVVPAGTWQYIELSLAGDFVKHATSYFIDAVALLQDTVTPVFVATRPVSVTSISSYPNPFVANTTIHFALQAEGEVQLTVIDGLGREIDHIDAGYLSNGIHDIPLAVKSSGFYFVRLFLNGQPVGNPLKITSR